MLGGDFRQAGGDIECCCGGGGGANGVRPRGDRRHQGVVQFGFQRQHPRRRLTDARFEPRQFVGAVARGVGHALPVTEFGPKLAGEARVDLDEIADDVVVADFERRDAGGRGVTGLKRGDVAAAFIAQAPQFVHVGAVAGGNKAAVAGGERQVGRQSARKFFHQSAVIAQAERHRRQRRRRLARGQRVAQGGAAREAIAQARQIARAAAREAEPR